MDHPHAENKNGKEIVKGTEYAHKDGLFFSSLQTQQMFYTLIEKGFTVAFKDGKPSLTQQKGAEFWSLVSSGRQGAYFRQKTDGKKIVTGLLTGDYAFKVSLPEYFKSSGRSMITKSLSISIEVISGTGTEKIISFQTILNKATPMLESKFSIWSHQNNATALIEFKSTSFFTRLFVKSSLIFFELPRIKEEIMLERKATKKLLRSGEYFVELTKGAKGVGMTLGYDKKLKHVIIKSVNPIGAAAKTNKLSPGCLVLGINGKRLEEVKFKQVIKILRSVPRVVFLIIKPKLEGYVVSFSETAKVKKVEDLKLESIKTHGSKIPHKLTNSQKVAPPVPPRRKCFKKPNSLDKHAKPRPPPRRVPTAEDDFQVSIDTSSVKNNSNQAETDHIFQKYLKMKKSGIPQGAIFNAWLRDSCKVTGPEDFWENAWKLDVYTTLGLESKIELRHESSKPIVQADTSPRTKTSFKLDHNLQGHSKQIITQNETNVIEEKTSKTSSLNEDAMKYKNMKKSRLPEGAIFNAWVRDGAPRCITLDFWSGPWKEEFVKHQNRSIKALNIEKSTSKEKAGNIEQKQLRSLDKFSKVIEMEAKKPRNPTEELKMFDRSALKKRPIKTKITNSKPVRCNNPLQELQSFDISKLKKISLDKEKKNMKQASSPSNPLLAALNEFHSKKKMNSKQSGSNGQENVDSVKLDMEAQSHRSKVESVKLISPLDEIQGFDRTKLKKTSDMEKIEKPPTTLTEAFAQKLSQVRGDVFEDESDSDDSWDDDDNWAM